MNDSSQSFMKKGITPEGNLIMLNSDIDEQNCCDPSTWIESFLERLNPVHYLNLYPDLRSSKISPNEHWSSQGKKEGRLPNLSLFYNKCPKFSVDAYLKFNRDLSHLSKYEAIAHYWAHGFREGRKCYEIPNTYLNSEGDVNYTVSSLFRGMGYRRVWVADSLRQFGERLCKIYDLSLNPRASHFLSENRRKINFLKREEFNMRGDNDKRSNPWGSFEDLVKLEHGETDEQEPEDILRYVEGLSIHLPERFLQWIHQIVREDDRNFEMGEQDLSLTLGTDIQQVYVSDKEKKDLTSIIMTQTDKFGDNGNLLQGRHLLFGLYDKYDYLLLAFLLKNWRINDPKIGIIWGGSDINKLSEPEYLTFIIDYSMILEHYAISKNVQDRLFYHGIISEYKPIELHSKEYYRSFCKNLDYNRGRAIYVYNGLLRGQEKKYGATIYEELIEKIPLEHQTVIFSNQLSIPHEHMPLVYLNSTIVLRLTAWDGNANTVQEANTMSIPVFSNFDDSYIAIPWSTSEQLYQDSMKILEKDNLPKILISLILIAIIMKRYSGSGTKSPDQVIKASFTRSETNSEVSSENSLGINKTTSLEELSELEGRIINDQIEIDSLDREEISEISGDRVEFATDLINTVDKWCESPRYLDFSRIAELKEEDFLVIEENLENYVKEIEHSKKILFICGDYPMYGGAATNCHKIVEYLQNGLYTSFPEKRVRRQIVELYYLHSDKASSLEEIRWRLNQQHVKVTTKKRFSKSIEHLKIEPDLIILRNCLPKNLMKSVKDRYPNVMIHYMIAGIFHNGLNEPYESRKDDQYLNKAAIDTALCADRIFCNSQHTLDIMLDIEPNLGRKSSLLYFTFFPFIKQRPSCCDHEGFERRPYTFVIVISDFKRLIKNAEGACELILNSPDYRNNEETPVLLIGENSEDFAEKYGFFKFGLISNVQDYLRMSKYLVCASYYESCSNAVIEAIMCGCKIIYPSLKDFTYCD